MYVCKMRVLGLGETCGTLVSHTRSHMHTQPQHVLYNGAQGGSAAPATSSTAPALPLLGLTPNDPKDERDALHGLIMVRAC